MALLEILHFPDSRLRLKAQPVSQVDDQVRQMVSDMFETMYNAPGIGLAATQVNIQLAIIVIDDSIIVGFIRQSGSFLSSETSITIMASWIFT